MSGWHAFRVEAPDLAARVQAAFERNRHMTMATLRRDGSPRISGTEIDFDGGEVRIGSMANARKARDLLRDPRVAIHGPTVDPHHETKEWIGEAKLSGRAVVRSNDDPEDDSHGFVIDVEEVVFTHLNAAGDALVIESWHPDRGVEIVER